MNTTGPFTLAEVRANTPQIVASDDFVCSIAFAGGDYEKQYLVSDLDLLGWGTQRDVRLNILETVNGDAAKLVDRLVGQQVQVRVELYDVHACLLRQTEHLVQLDQTSVVEPFTHECKPMKLSVVLRAVR